MQHFKGEQLVIVVVQPSAEIQTGVPAGSKRTERKEDLNVFHMDILHLFCHCVVCYYVVFPVPVYGELDHKKGGGVPPSVFIMGSICGPAGAKLPFTLTASG